MSIQSEIDRINGNISSAYNAAQSKGANIPAAPNSANLAATIASIPQEGGSGGGNVSIASFVPPNPIEFYNGYPLIELPGMQQSYLDNMAMLVVSFIDNNYGVNFTVTLINTLYNGFYAEYIGLYGQMHTISYYDGILSAWDYGPELYGLTIFYRV